MSKASAALSPSEIVNSPELFAKTFLKIQSKEKELIPFRWNRAQKHFQDNRTGRDLILKARQLGFSTLIQGEILRRLVTKTSTSITLSHKAKSTQTLRRMADRFWKHCKFNDLQPKREYANATVVTYPEFDSTSIIETAGSLDAGRGDTYTDFHGSEVAFWKDAKNIITGAMQGGDPDIVLESTPNGAQGYFYELCSAAGTVEQPSDTSNWTLHFYSWWWDEGYQEELSEEEADSFVYTDDELDASRKAKMQGFSEGLSPEQIKWRRGKIKDLFDMFPQEYPEDAQSCFLTSGNSYFGDTSNNFNAEEGVEYNPTHRYSGGIDFAQSNDFLVYSISDRTDNCQVAQLRINKLPWEELRKQCYEYYCKFSWEGEYQAIKKQLDLELKLHNITLSQHEGLLKSAQKRRKKESFLTAAEQNSIGSVNIELMEKLGMPLEAFDTTNTSKAEIMSEQRVSLSNGYQMLDRNATKHEYRAFVATQLPSGAWRLAAEGSSHDDTVIATALDNYAGMSGLTVSLAAE